MAYDNHTALAAALVTNSPGVGGVTFNLTAGTGALFPTGTFSCTVWVANTLPVRTAAQLAIPNSALAEIVRGSVAGDVFTASARAQENTTAQAWAIGSVIGNTITALDITAIEAEALGGTVTETGGVTSGHLAVFADNTGLVIQDGGAVPTSYTLPAATTTTLGGIIVPTAGNLAVDGSGNVSVPLGSSSILGVVKVDNTTITAAAGVISAVGGAGNVVGPASASASDVVLFDGTTGKLIKDSGAAFTPTGIGLGSVTNDAQTKAAVMPNTAPSAGQIPVGTGSAYVPQTVSADGTLSSAGALSVNQLHAAAMYSSATDSGVNASFVLPIIVYKKTIALSTSGNVDLATITLPNGIARWIPVAGRTADSYMSVVVAEGSTSTLAASVLTLWSATGGTGTQLSVSSTLTNLNGTINRAQSIPGNNGIPAQTGTSIVIRQTSASANAGNVSVYFAIIPLP